MGGWGWWDCLLARAQSAVWAFIVSIVGGGGVIVIIITTTTITIMIMIIIIVIIVIVFVIVIVTIIIKHDKLLLRRTASRAGRRRLPFRSERSPAAAAAATAGDGAFSCAARVARHSNEPPCRQLFLRAPSSPVAAAACAHAPYDRPLALGGLGPCARPPPAPAEPVT